MTANRLLIPLTFAAACRVAPVGELDTGGPLSVDTSALVGAWPEPVSCGIASPASGSAWMVDEEVPFAVTAAGLDGERFFLRIDGEPSLQWLLPSDDVAWLRLPPEPGEHVVTGQVEATSGCLAESVVVWVVAPG